MTATQLLETPFIKKAQTEVILEGIVNEAATLIANGGLFKNNEYNEVYIFFFFIILYLYNMFYNINIFNNINIFIKYQYIFLLYKKGT